MAEPYAGGDSNGAESTAVYSARIVEDRTVHDTANGSSDAVTTARFAVSVAQGSEHVKPKEAMGTRGSPAAGLTTGEDKHYTKVEDHSKDEDLPMLDKEMIDHADDDLDPAAEPADALETPNGMDDTIDPEEDELSPPPDSPIDEPELTSRGSSVPANVLEDEIVVGTKANKHLSAKPSPVHPASEHEDVEMDDAEEESVASQKRKRASTLMDMPDE